MRAQLTARLGPEVEDILDEFLGYAMGQENIGLPGLDAFVEALTLSPPDIKREMDQGRNEVWIMTTHAAKGLKPLLSFWLMAGVSLIIASTSQSFCLSHPNAPHGAVKAMRGKE